VCVCILLGIRFNGGSCEDGTGSSASIKDGKFLDNMSECQILEKNSYKHCILRCNTMGRYVRLGGNSTARCLDMQDTQTLRPHYVLTLCNEYKSYIKMRIHCDCSLGNNQVCFI
jgi:hypothetical protein